MMSRLFALCLSVILCAWSARAWAESAGDFDAHVTTFVSKHCVPCHGPQKQKGDLTLHSFKDAKSILAARKVWQNVLQMVEGGDMPPSGRPRPPQPELDAFVRKVRDIFESADRAARPDPGRVTMRRLNRTEYNNTIRDLLGVDFQPADDFPSDDVGYGFDNIGDVLTLSPVLMERYLAAAEAIAHRAIVATEPPPPPRRERLARFLEPAVKSRDAFRVLKPGGERLAAVFLLPEEGEYRASAKVFADLVAGKPALLGLFVNDKLQKTFTVKSSNEKALDRFQVVVTLPKGVGRVAVQFMPENAEKSALHVHSLHLDGPSGLPAHHRKLMAHAPGLDHHEAAREILTRFVTRAYRRPATTDEVERLLRLVDQAEKNGERWEAGIELAVLAVLASPKFLFRVELDNQPDSPAPHLIDDYQLASRLSYFLWGSMPDDELFALAGRKELHGNLEAQVRRMLKDERSRSLVSDFATQWLQLRLLRNVTPDQKLFPDFNEKLRKAMLKETELFLQAIVEEDRNVLDLIDGRFTFLNERLARHYGIADTAGNRVGEKAKTTGGAPIRGEGFVKVSLGEEGRTGLLTQAAILTITSNPTRTSPVKRGRWVLEQVLGTPPPPPPPNVPPLPEGERAELKGSLRQRLEQHRANPSCAGCHSRMDPIGFGFENYDAVGRFRTKDGNFPIDASGTLPGGRSFSGPVELRAILKGKKELFHRCLAEKMLTYALGRGLEYYDRRAVDTILSELDRGEGRFSALVLAIVKSDPFRLRRGKDATP